MQRGAGVSGIAVWLHVAAVCVHCESRVHVHVRVCFRRMCCSNVCAGDWALGHMCILVYTIRRLVCYRLMIALSSTGQLLDAF